MSYEGISVREAMEKLNNLNSGWYLPYIQRQYVWGERSESEGYVCLLLDSLLKRYPIGGLVLWETMKPVSISVIAVDAGFVDPAGSLFQQVKELEYLCEQKLDAAPLADFLGEPPESLFVSSDRAL